MPWQFVIVTEVVAGMTDLNCRFVEFDELSRQVIGLRFIALRPLKNWKERVLREDVFDVGDEEFLMLLLVMDPQDHDRLDLAKQFLIRVRDEIVNIGIDRCAIFLCFFNRWPRYEAAEVAPMHRARGIVIRIEEISVFRMGVAITGDPPFQNERFKKPGRMRKMPFCRADFRHRLHDAILRREIFGEPAAKVSDFVKTREQTVRRRILGRARFRGRRSIFWSDRGVDQVIPPSSSSSSLRASSI